MQSGGLTFFELRLQAQAASTAGGLANRISNPMLMQNAVHLRPVASP